MKISKAVVNDWATVLADAIPQGVAAEYGQIRVLYKQDSSVEDHELVVAGYASPQVIDREKHLITKEALKADLPRFLAHPKYRNSMVVHSNIEVGEVLPSWTNPETGEEFTTKVDDIGLFVVIKVRTDKYRPEICAKVERDILDGKLSAFSISGDAPFDSRRHVCNNGTCFWIIDKIILYEITILIGTNQMVATPDGPRLISEIQPGDMVITHRRRARTVKSTGKVLFQGEMVELEEEDGAVIRVSPEHKVRAKKPGMERPIWIPAGELEAGDELVIYSRTPKRNRRGGIKTPEGREVQRRAVTSDEFKVTRSRAQTKKWQDPEYRVRMLAKLEHSRHASKRSWAKPKPVISAEEHRQRELARRDAIAEATRQRWADPEYKERVSTAQREAWDSSDPARRAKASDTLKLLQQEAEFNQKRIAALHARPNGAETMLWSALGPLGFWFTGDGKLITKSGLNPDFWNGDGRVVELYGDYWHRGQDPAERIARLETDGYRCLVVWEREVNEDIAAVVQRVKEFCGG